MTDGEICALYRQAKDKEAQIKILAELADKSKESIRSTLQAHGYITDNAPGRNIKQSAKKDTEKKTKKNAERDAKLQELLSQGKSAKEIAEEFDVHPGTVRLWIRKGAGEMMQPHKDTAVAMPPTTMPPLPTADRAEQDRLIRTAASKCRQSITALSKGDVHMGCFALGEAYNLMVQLGKLSGTDVDRSAQGPFASVKEGIL